MEELFDVVDEHDQLIGRATRKEVHSTGLIHRSVLFFIFDRDGRVFVNQRTENKEFYPGHWSIVFGGHVHAGESYENAVVREAEEEAGVTGNPFHMAAFRKRFDALDRENVRVYGLVADGMPVLDPGEIRQGMFMTKDELELKLDTEKFLPETPLLHDILEDFTRRQPLHPGQ